MKIFEELKKEGMKRVILDTDTYNEIDDQFALAMTLLSPERIDLVCVTAAPFHNSLSESFGDGMEKSYREIGICSEKVKLSHGTKIPAYYRGSTERMPDPKTPVESEAAHAIARHVMEYDGITYIAAIGAITNVASAILLHPEIKDKIALLWLGGEARWFTAREFNLIGDVNAANAVFASGVPMMLFPCHGVVSHLIMTIHELEHFLRGNSPLGDYLCDNVARCEPKNALSWSRVIWDIAVICGILDPGSLRSVVTVPRPYVNEDLSYAWDVNPGEIEHVDMIFRDRMISLMLRKLMK